MSNPRAVSEAAAMIRWFENSGRPLPGHTAANPLGSWASWPGPEAPGVERLSLDLQEAKDLLDAHYPSNSFDWNECLTTAVDAIARSVPEFRRQGDAWHAPTAAVWHAAWVLTLVVLLKGSALHVPETLREQMEWFAKGRWPAAYSAESALADKKEYVVL